MQIDLRVAELPDQPLRAKVCVLGGGIAGLVLAHKLAAQGVDVLLLEAGGLLSHEEAPRAPVEMLAEPHAGSMESRGIALGGSSRTWGGQLLPASAAPASRPWPVPANELAGFEREAEALLGVNDRPYEALAFFAAANEPSPHSLLDMPGVTQRFSKFVPFAQRHIGQTLGRELLSHPQARVLLNATATEVLPNPDNPALVAAVLVRSPKQGCLRVEAEQYVLAAGTLETVRLLLASRRSTPMGLGNAYGQLGRNVHDHLTLTAATFTGVARERVVRELRPWVFGGPRGAVVHSLKSEAEERCPQTDVALTMMAHMVIEEPENSGVGAVRSWLYARQQQNASAPGFAALLAQMPLAGRAAAHLSWSAWRLHRRYVSPQATVTLRLNAAQCVPSSSHIRLSENADAYGQPLAALHWSVSDAEHAVFRSFAHKLKLHLAAAGCPPADVCWAPDLLASEGSPSAKPSKFCAQLTDARHLMGGALMGTDPRTSVVDPNLQVHGVQNLHIASLATLLDGRAQLPTLTLVALSLRLAARFTSLLR